MRRPLRPPPAPPRVEPRPAANPALRIPHDVVNEVVLLAAVIVDETAAKKYLPAIPSDNFYGSGHAAAWTVLQEIQRRGLHYDPATVQQLSGGTVDASVLEEYVRERPEPPPNLGHHADMIRWDRARIELVRGPLQAFLEALRNPRTDPDQLRAMSRRLPESLDGYSSQRYLRDPAHLLREQAKELTDRRKGHAIFPFGLDGLDVYSEGELLAGRVVAGTSRLIPGAAPGKVTVVTGASGSGKTTTTIGVALAQAKLQRRVLLGAWEQGSGLTLELAAAMSLGWSRTLLSLGEYTEADQHELEAEMERLSEYLRFFELPFGRARGERGGNDRNLDLIQQVISDSACDLFIGDLYRRAFKETNPDDEEQALYRTQAIAQEQHCHVMLIHQLRLKDLEAREDKRPTREGMKGSSGWVEVADTLLAWYRPGLYKRIPDDRVQCLILKQRYGPWPLAVEFEFDPDYGCVANGRGIEYERPGEQGEIDGFLGEQTVGRRRRRAP